MKLYRVREPFGGVTFEHLVIAACPNDAIDRLSLAGGNRKKMTVEGCWQLTAGHIESYKIDT